MVAGLYHPGVWDGRFGYIVTWRTAAYPLGFYLPLSAVPVLRWVAGVYAGVVLLSVGLHKVQEVSAVRATLVSTGTTMVLVFAGYLLLRL